MRFVGHLVAFLLFVSLSLAFAQEPADKNPTGGRPAAGEKAGMTMTRNVAELEKFAKMVLGTWAVRETHEASDMGPAGTSVGTAMFRRGPGGFSVIEDLSMNGSMGKFKGIGVFWYDLNEQAYKGLWCDSMTPLCDPNSVAKWDGDKLVARTTAAMPDGKKLYMRDEYSDITPSSFTFTIYQGPDENSQKQSMTMKYTRKSGPAAATRPDPRR